MAASVIAAIVFMGSILAVFTPATRAAESAALERINFGLSAAGSVASAPLWMAQDSGAFKKYGLDVKLIFLRDLDDRPFPRPEGFKIALELTAQQTPLTKGVDAERFIDASLLRELERSGNFAVSSGAK